MKVSDGRMWGSVRAGGCRSLDGKASPTRAHRLRPKPPSHNPLYSALRRSGKEGMWHY